MRGIQNPRRLVVRIVGAEIGEQPGAEPLGLADIEIRPVGIEHPVDRGAVLGQLSQPPAESSGGR